MPHSGSLIELRDRLGRALDPKTVFRAQVWGNPKPMVAARKEAQKAFGEDSVEPIDSNRLAGIVAKFFRKQEVSSFTDLKYLCFGVLVPGPNGLALIDKPDLMARLMELVQARKTSAKQFRRSYQGLLASYFGFNLLAEQPQTRLQNWTRLRSYLASELDHIVDSARGKGLVPEWLQVLHEHRNLFSEKPCERYAAALAAGKVSELQALSERLAISQSSWVWVLALMAYVDHVCAQSDTVFESHLTELLRLINGQRELKLPAGLVTKATASVVRRYFKLATKPEHDALRETCLKHIGNPWLARAAWDASVGHEPTRLMVDSWLKRRLIKDFFEHLAHDGSADVRRLNFWLKWEPQITSMWFVLGESARNNRTAAFESLRKRMEGRERKLSDNNALNNAFVMLIGPLLVIEFGSTGNACFVFAAAEFQTNLDKVWLDTNSELKQKASRRARLLHQGNWEWNFDQKLKQLLWEVPASLGELVHTKAVAQPATSWPPVPKPFAAAAVSAATTASAIPAATAPGRAISQVERAPEGLSADALAGKGLSEADVEFLKRRCRHTGLEFEDNRHSKGAFWILGLNEHVDQEFITTLKKIGFQRKAGTDDYWYKRNSP